jgi:hypothetical protein
MVSPSITRTSAALMVATLRELGILGKKAPPMIRAEIASTQMIANLRQFDLVARSFLVRAACLSETTLAISIRERQDY